MCMAEIYWRESRNVAVFIIVTHACRLTSILISTCAPVERRYVSEMSHSVRLYVRLFRTYMMQCCRK